MQGDECSTAWNNTKEEIGFIWRCFLFLVLLTKANCSAQINLFWSVLMTL